jgi:DNA-binding MarR family transcriptional regulator
MSEHTFSEELFRVLRLIALVNNDSQRNLSRHLNISLGKTNYLLQSLIKKGFIEIRNLAEGDQKLKKVRYHLTRKGLKYKMEMAYYYLTIKEQEYLDLKKELTQQRSVHAQR